MKGWIAVLLLLPAVSPAFASSRARRGAELFVASGCQHCHSVDHVGGKRGPDLSNVGRTLKKVAIRRQIMQGGAQMPPFGQMLQPDEIKDLVAYLHSCRQNPGK